MSLVDLEQLSELEAIFAHKGLARSIVAVRDSLRDQLNDLRAVRRDTPRCQFVLHDIVGIAACYALTGLSVRAHAYKVGLTEDGLTLAQIATLSDLVDLCAEEVLSILAESRRRRDSSLEAA